MEIIDKSSVTDLSNDKGKQLKKLYQLAKEIRAPFLEQAIFIERLVEDIASQHFCPEEARRRLFFSLIISETDFTFSSKIKIFKRILQLCYPDLIKKHSDIIDELQKVRRFRNRIAHSMLDTSDKSLAKKFTDRVQLIYYQDGRTKQQIVTLTEIKERLKACSRIVLTLVDIQKEVIQQVSANTA